MATRASRARDGTAPGRDAPGVAGAREAMRAGRPDLRLLLVAGVVWLACVLARWLTVTAAVAAVLALAASAAVAAAGAVRGRPGAATLVACLIAVAAAVLGAAVRQHDRASGPVTEFARRGAAATVDVVVTSDPRVLSPRPGRAAGRAGLVLVRARAERIAVGGAIWRVRVPVLLIGRAQGWRDVLPSTRMRIAGRLATPRPGDDLSAVISLRGPPALLSAPSRLQQLSGRLRAGLRRASSGLSQPERGLLPGLVDGDVSELQPTVQANFQTAGLTHLTAVSGSNCAILLAVVLVIVRRTRLRVPGRALCLLLTVALFVLVARPDPSVLRAAAMALVTVLALISGRPRAAPPALGAAVLALLLLDPGLAVRIGFALSVLATAGLLFLAPGWRVGLARRMPGWLADGIAVAAAAQVACTPLLAAAFGSVGLVAVPANVLAVPAVAPATVLGVGATALSQLCMPLAVVLAHIAAISCWWLVTVARVASRLPAAAIPWRQGLAGAALALLSSWLVVVALRRRRGRLLLAAVAAGIVLARAVAAPLVVAPWPPAGWQLLMCDVGQGDAMLLATGGSAPVLLDAGPDPESLARCLREAGVRSLDRIVLTHLHADHVDGLPAVLGRLPVGAIEVGPFTEPASTWRWLQRQAMTAGVPLQRAPVGSEERAGDLVWSVLAPQSALHGTDSDPNNNSLVLSADVSGVRFLLTGDVETEAQQALLAEPTLLAADVLKVPHHGSDRQDPRFLQAVGATIGLISVGRDNSYGHPAPGLLQRLRAGGTRVFRTDLDGALAIKRDSAGELTVTTQRGRGRAAHASAVVGVPAVRLTQAEPRA